MGQDDSGTPVGKREWLPANVSPLVGSSIQIATKTNVADSQRHITFGAGSEMAQAKVTHADMSRSRNFYELVARDAAYGAYIKNFGAIDWSMATIVTAHAEDSVTVEVVVMKR